MRNAALGAGLALATLALPLFVPAADAARETEIVPFLHVKGGLGFRGQKVQGIYERDGVRIGARDEIRNFVDIEGRFGAWYGLEVYFNTSYDTWDRVRWESINFAGTAPAGGDDQEERRKGLTDTRLGARYAILSEARNTGDVSTWTIETAVKIPGAYEIYPTTKTETGPAPKESAAGTPGFEWLLKTGFSKRVRFADPYVTFYYLHRGSASSPSDDVASYDIADTWGTFFGTELVGFERKADNLKFSGDIGIGWRFVNEGEVPANRFIYGPDGTPATGPGAPTGNVVKEQRYIRYDGRIGFFYQLQKHAQATGHLTYGIPGQHFIEVYDDSFADPQNGGRIRNKDFVDFGYEFHMNVAF